MVEVGVERIKSQKLLKLSNPVVASAGWKTNGTNALPRDAGS